MAKSKPKPVSAAAALKQLKAGNDRFVRDRSVMEPQDENVRSRWEKSQHPFAIILSCADSRVIPEIIFDAAIGELFVIRVAGNIANTSSLASIEYAVAELKTKLIVVLGHESCGAVKAALAAPDLGHNLNHLLAHLKPAVGKRKPTANPSAAIVKKTVEENARLNAAALRDRSAIIADAKDVDVRPAYYQIVKGKVTWL